MRVRIAACALMITGLLAPQAMAAPAVSYSSSNVQPYGYYPGPSEPSISRGRIAMQSDAQRQRVYRQMPKIEQAVARQLDGADLQLSDLRTGRYQKALIICGVVDSVAASGETDKRRFIARPAIATLETAENSQAFRAGWKKVGCGF